MLSQGRFWPKTWDSLGLPASSRAKFNFTDGIPRVRKRRLRALQLDTLSSVLWAAPPPC